MKTVVFCDDQDGFWVGRKEWMKWEGWNILCVADPEYRGGSVVDDILREIDKKEIEEPFYVVTDANFGAGEPLGGAKLLSVLFEARRILRGVVYSIEPETGNVLTKQIEAGAACAVKNDERPDCEKTKEILRFLDYGEVPVPRPETQIQLLSRAIHRLENLALPLRLDVETLEGRESEMTTVEAIWEDYFNPPEKPLKSSKDCGFLLPERTFSEGTPGIENEIIRILDAVRSVPKVTEGEEWKALDSDQGFAADTTAMVLGIEEARTNTDALKEKGDDLKQALTVVRDKILDVSKELRTLRSRLEAEEEGRGS